MPLIRSQTRAQRRGVLAVNAGRWLDHERLPGLLVLAALLAGFIAANSTFAPVYWRVHHLPVHLGIGTLAFREPLIEFINSGLMALFFLQISLQLRRELAEGPLASPRAAAMPLLAAIGGMAMPALIYLSINSADPAGLHGWAIPTATDTVLAISVLSLLGRRTPAALKVFLLALAVFDDIGAVLIIGLFYSSPASPWAFAAAALSAAMLAAAGRMRIARPAPYLLLGLALWVALGRAGIEAALAGAVVGACYMRSGDMPGSGSPTSALEQRLRPWVDYGVVPLFTFFNAGVPVSADALADLLQPVGLGVVAGLALGKPLGIAGAAWLAEKAGLAHRPGGIRWSALCGAGALAGIGFTMSLFIGSLAFGQNSALQTVRLAVLVASALAALAGLTLLWASTRSRSPCGSGPR